MEMESASGSAFLSGFCQYYSVLTDDGDFSGCSEGIGNNGYSESDPFTNYQPEYYSMEYKDEPACPTITIQALESNEEFENIGPGNVDNSIEYFSFNLDQMNVPITGADPSTIDLDYLNFNDAYPFDWDLNLDSIITTKTVLPDLTPLCNDICSELLGESEEMLLTTSVNQQDEKDNSEGPVVEEENVEKPKFQCNYDQCRKIYAKAAHLRSHLRRHLGHKPYICTEVNCQWRFNRSDELARHRRSHSGIKPYHCDYCPKTFSRSDHLAKHRKVHERKFASGKAKGVWRVLPKAKPGRKPKAAPSKPTEY